MTALLLCSLAQTGHALVLGQPIIQSTKEQLLYMELPYSEATNIKSIRVSIEEDDEISKLGINSKDMSFVVRKNGANFGVIIITSNKPIRSSRINFLLNVREADTPYLKRINIPFKVTNSSTTAEQNSEDKALSPVNINPNTDLTSSKTDKNRVSPPQEQESGAKFYYRVKSQDTLWSIASKISEQTGERLDDIAKQIKQDNPNAFTRQNTSHIKSGARIVIFGSKPIQNALQEVEKSQKEPTTQLSQDIQKELSQTKARIRVLENEIFKLQREMKQKNVKFDVVNARINDLKQQIRELNEKSAR